MPKGDGEDYLEPEHAEELRKLGQGGLLSRRRRVFAARGALQRALDPKLVGLVVQPDSWLGTCTDVPIDGSARACAVGDCTCIVPTLGDPRETSGPRIDRIPSTRPPWWLRQYRELKKLFFLAPSKCPIDLFGPVATRTMLEQALLGLEANQLFFFSFFFPLFLFSALLPALPTPCSCSRDLLES